jgi:microcystin-dependent protein
MATSSPRLSIPEISGTDAESAFVAVDATMAGILDNAAIYVQGASSARPSAPVTGTFYFATDTGAWSVYLNGAWYLIGAAGPAIGSMMEFAGTTYPADPDGVQRWHVCDGTAIGRTAYSQLYATIGTSYGAGDGSTTFNLPDTRGRTTVGAGGGSGLTSRGLASTGGEENHLLSLSEINHTNAFPFAVQESGGTIVFVQGPPWNGFINAGSGNITWAVTSALTMADPSVGIGSGPGGSYPNTGGINAGGMYNSVHNNMQPFTAVNRVIRIL